MTTVIQPYKASHYPENVLDDALSHLTEEDMNSLLNRYYQNETIQALLEEYTINLRTNQLVKAFPPIITEMICPYCDEVMLKERPGRASPTKKVAMCYVCLHTEESHCQCKNCVAYRKQTEEAVNSLRREEVKRVFDVRKLPKVSEETLTLETRLYLATILREALTEDMTYLLPLESFSLAPTISLTDEMVNKLVNQAILVPDICSPLNSFRYDDEDAPTGFYIFQVNYRVNVEPTDGQYSEMIQRLLHIDPTMYAYEYEWNEEMWRKIALHEVLQYLYYSLDKVRYDFKAGEKTISIMEELLCHFSVSQVFGLIYKSIANATKYQQETRITNKHAANLVVSGCQRLGERAAAERWDLTRFRRDYNLPQTAISELFFNRVLSIGTLGFDTTPTKDL